MSKESKDAAAKDKAAQNKADDAALTNALSVEDTNLVQTDAELPAGVEDIKRHTPPRHDLLAGKYDLAPITNALNNVLNLRNVPGLAKEDFVKEFEAQLVEILDVSDIAPEKWNQMINHDSQIPGAVYEGHQL